MPNSIHSSQINTSRFSGAVSCLGRRSSRSWCFFTIRTRLDPTYDAGSSWSKENSWQAAANRTHPPISRTKSRSGKWSIFPDLVSFASSQINKLPRFEKGSRQSDPDFKRRSSSTSYNSSICVNESYKRLSADFLWSSWRNGLLTCKSIPIL